MGWGEKNNPRSEWNRKRNSGQMPVVSEPIKGVPNLGKKSLWQKIKDYFNVGYFWR